MSKTALRNTTVTNTEILGSNIERRDGKLVMVTNIRHTSRRYDGRGFAGITEQFQVITLPLRQVEELQASLAGAMRYVVSGEAAEDGDNLLENEANLTILNVADKSFVAGKFRSWNEARQYVSWAVSVGLNTQMWGLFADRDPDHCIEYLARVGKEQTNA